MSKETVMIKDPNDPYSGHILFGNREDPIPNDSLISITLGENFSIWKTVINGLVSQLVIKQMKKSSGFLHGELKGHLKEGYGLTLSVWERTSMVPFRDRGAHKFAMRFFSWIFFSGKSHAYFLTYTSNGLIPTVDEARELVHEFGKFYDGGKFVRQAKRPKFQEELI